MTRARWAPVAALLVVAVAPSAAGHASPPVAAPDLPGICSAVDPAPMRLSGCDAVTVGMTVAPQTPQVSSAGLPCVASLTHCATWSATNDGPTQGSDYGYAAASDAAGTRLFTAGHVTTAAGASGTVLAYDMGTGDLQWSSALPGTADKSIVVTTSLQAAPDGSAAFAVSSVFGAGDCHTDVSSYAGDSGELLWSASLAPSTSHCLYYLDSVLNSDGSRLFVITTWTEGGGREISVAAAYDTATGEQLWSTSTPATAAGFRHWRVALAPDDQTVYVASSTLVASGPVNVPTRWNVFAYDAGDGSSRWTSEYDCRRLYGSIEPVTTQASPYCLDPAGIVAAGDGVFLQGSNGSGWGTTQVAAFAAADGQQRWHRDLDALESFIYSLDRGLAASPDGASVYAGYVRLDPSSTQAPQFVVAALSGADGATLWSAVAPAATSAAFYCAGCGPKLTTDADGSRVVMTGSFPLGQSVLFTQSLNAASGSVAWSDITLIDPSSSVTTLPEGLTVPASGNRIGIAGITTNFGAAPCTATQSCYDQFAIVYPSN